MENVALPALPRTALRRLEFLSGQYVGNQTLYAPGEEAVSYQACCSISREACERFIKIEFYAEIPDRGIETSTSFLTYSTRKEVYELWQFSSSSEEPLHMVGSFRGRQLILVSEPWVMPWGLQRLRGTFTPGLDGCFEYLAEMWEPDGYARFKHSRFHRIPYDA